jgi:hypothetical protein
MIDLQEPGNLENLDSSTMAQGDTVASRMIHYTPEM